ncbi:hypothetical protein LWI29_025808 [Acer saccharum]|uniref:Uncharacterized protein n=1 Tax=Acer saccharum TaxID=4024 RepID=A0AA39W7N9_ACESA|nr:hypothetical protein LWI29_025808 [Acer saccharum]
MSGPPPAVEGGGTEAVEGHQHDHRSSGSSVEQALQARLLGGAHNYLFCSTSPQSTDAAHDFASFPFDIVLAMDNKNPSKTALTTTLKATIVMRAVSVAAITPEKYGSESNNSRKESKPGTRTVIVVSRFTLRLRASATRFVMPALCFRTKVCVQVVPVNWISRVKFVGCLSLRLLSPTWVSVGSNRLRTAFAFMHWSAHLQSKCPTGGEVLHPYEATLQYPGQRSLYRVQLHCLAREEVLNPYRATPQYPHERPLHCLAEEEVHCPAREEVLNPCRATPQYPHERPVHCLSVYLSPARASPLEPHNEKGYSYASESMSPEVSVSYRPTPCVAHL